ncbi:LOB domain-containing protein 12 [Linum grandiflorum]
MSREKVVILLSYDAGTRIRDLVYGCVGAISELKNRLKQIHMKLMPLDKSSSNTLLRDLIIGRCMIKH